MTKIPPGSIFEIRSASDGSNPAPSDILVRTENMEVIRLAIAAGEEKPSYKSPGDVTILCLEGRLSVTVDGELRELLPDQLMHLPPNVPHSIRAIEESAALLTIVPAAKTSSSTETATVVSERISFEIDETGAPPLHNSSDAAAGRGVRG